MSKKKIHVFTDELAFTLLKHLPQNHPAFRSFEFVVGLNHPKDSDAVVFWNRSEISLTLSLPKSRIAYVAAEAEDVREISSRFLNQFGYVHSPTAKPLETHHVRKSPCWPWLAGVSFADRTRKAETKGYDFFAAFEPPEKISKVSVITSKLATQPIHVKRLEFLKRLQEIIPEYLEVFGRGIRPVDDKMEALTPFKYHLALENTLLPHAWTEKISDPFLCWCHPFYVGPKNVDEYFPDGSFTPLDMDDPEGAARTIVDAIENDKWSANLENLNQARRIILDDQNAGQVLLNAVEVLLSNPAGDHGRHRISSDMSLLAEKKTAGQLFAWAAINVLQLFDRECEVKFWRKRVLRKRGEAR